jgi:hypothetical protein
MNTNKFTVRAFMGLCLSGMLFTTACNTDQDDELQQEVVQNAENSKVIPGQYIIVMKETDANSARTLANTSFNSREEKASAFAAHRQKVAKEVSSLLRTHGINEENMRHLYSASFPGFAARVSDEKLALLKNDDRIAYIEADQVVSLEQIDEKQTSNARAMAQSTPWGIQAVGYGNYEGGSRWAWVIDTGIDLDHPDLNVATSWSTSYVGGSADDGNGHGTHVAGTIAAKNNSIGVVGVAAGATVVAVRVLDANGSGSNSGVLAGVDYVRANAYVNDVANMSLGGGASTTLDNAVKNAASAGVYFALAAGNESQNANNVSPARANGSRIRTVSAHDINDRFASFSNFANPPIDVCAPGVSINSTWIGGGYRTISGTSMAAPHAAGIMLINNGTINIRGYVSNDPDGNADPLARR